MTYRGHVHNGRITLDEPVKLPEGAAVNIELLDQPRGGQVPSPEQDLISRGLLRAVPQGKDLARFRAWLPAQIDGKPLSQTIIEERR